MSNEEFFNQYKNPLWQKKRLEALNSSAFTCQSCKSEDATLHVHHKRYVKGRKIWEYEINELEILCEECHANAHIQKNLTQDFYSKFSSEQISEFFAVIVGFASTANRFNSVEFAESYEIVEDAFNLEIGQFAGILYNRLTIYDLVSLKKQIRNSKDGDTIVLTITKTNGA